MYKCAVRLVWYTQNKQEKYTKPDKVYQSTFTVYSIEKITENNFFTDLKYPTDSYQTS